MCFDALTLQREFHLWIVDDTHSAEFLFLSHVRILELRRLRFAVRVPSTLPPVSFMSSGPDDFSVSPFVSRDAGAKKSQFRQ